MNAGLFSKLSSEFQREISTRCGNEYPFLNQIFDNVDAAYQTVKRATVKTSIKGHAPSSDINCNNFNSKHKVNNHSSHSHKGSLSQFNTVTEKKGHYKNNFKDKNCKFSSGQHSLNNCSIYKTFDERKSRCIFLNLCFYCSSTQHTAENCPMKKKLLNYKIINSNITILSLALY